MISLSLSGIGRWANTRPVAASTTFKSMGALFPFTFSAAALIAFPSTARWTPFVCTISPIHSMNTHRNSSSSILVSRRDTVESDAIPFFRASPHFRSHFSCLLHHPRHLRRVVCPVTYPATIHTSTSASSCFFALGLRGSSTAFICSYNRLTWTGVFSHLHFQSKTIGQPLMFRP